MLIRNIPITRVRLIQPYRYRYVLSESYRYRYRYGLIESYRYRKNKSFLADTDTRCFNRYHTNISQYKPILADTDILIILNRYRYSFTCSYRYRYAYSYRYRYIGTWYRYRYEYPVSVEP